MSAQTEFEVKRYYCTISYTYSHRIIARRVCACVADMFYIPVQPIQIMMPDRCAMVFEGKRCPSPPSYVVSVVSGSDEYMVGVACVQHRASIRDRILALQENASIPEGLVRFTPLKPVGTDCIRADPDDMIQIQSPDSRRLGHVR